MYEPNAAGNEGEGGWNFGMKIYNGTVINDRRGFTLEFFNSYNGCEIYNVTSNNNISLGGAKDPTLAGDGIQDMRVYNCRIATGIELQMADVEVNNNYFTELNSDGMALWNNKDYMMNQQLSPRRNIFIHHNVFYRPATEGGDRTPMRVTSAHPTNFKFYNNTIDGNLPLRIDNAQTFNNVDIANNLFYNNTDFYGTIQFYNGAGSVTNSRVTNSRVTNNVYTSNWTNPPAGWGNTANMQIGNPGLTGSGNRPDPFYRPVAGSFLVGKGTTSNLPTGASTTAGAYEASTSGGNGPNLISNPSFDAEAFNTQTPSGWSEWGGPQGNHADASFTETAQGSRTGARHGTHWKGSAYEVGTDQFKTGLTNGLYTLRAWVRGAHGSSPAQMQVWGYDANSTSTRRTVDVPNTSAWTLLEIKDINVSNTNCNITFWSRAQANEWIHFEDVEFFKQGAGGTNPTLVNRATGGTVTARGENAPNEGKDKAFDGSASSKWLDFASTSWITYQFGGSATHAVSKYTITSANDESTRDPKSWTLQAWNGSAWVNLDTRSNETFASRFQKKEYTFTNSTSYNAYRLNITANNGATIT